MIGGPGGLLPEALPGAFPRGHPELRPSPPTAAFPGPRWKAPAAPASQRPHLGYCPARPGPRLPGELPRSSPAALPEGPPVLLLVFQRQPEASLTPWLAATLLRTGSRPPVSPGCLTWQCSSISSLREPRDCFRPCPKLRAWMAACVGDLVLKGELGSGLTPLSPWTTHFTSRSLQGLSHEVASPGKDQSKQGMG